MAALFTLGYLINLRAGAQVMRGEPGTADMIKLAVDCLTLWKFTTIIFVR